MTAPLKGSNGTVSLPTYTFASDLDSGLYRIGANNIGLAVNGAKVLDIATTGGAITGTFSATGTITSTGQFTASAGVLNSDGTVSLPGYSFTSDTDCGWYRIGANNIGAAVNGAKVLDVATTGLTVTGALSASTSISSTTSITAGNGFTVTAGAVSLPAGSVANSALAAPGGLTLLKKVSASNSASITFVNGVASVVFDATYDVYVLEVAALVCQTDDTCLNLTFTTDGGSTYLASAYQNNMLDNFATLLAGTTLISLTRNASSGAALGNATGENWNGTLKFYNPAGTAMHHVTCNASVSRSDSTTTPTLGSAANTGTAAINGFKLAMNSGNIVSGSFSLYGMRLS